MTDATTYYVSVVDADTIQLATTAPNALAGTVITTLTQGSTAEEHSFVSTLDTRPDFECTGTSGSAEYTACKWDRHRTLTLTSVVTLNSPTITGSKQIIQNGAAIDGGVFSGNTPDIGEAIILSSNPQTLTNNEFTANANMPGHGVEGDTVATYNFNGNLFTNYGLEGASGVGWEFDTELDVTGGATDTVDYTGHGLVTGDGIFYEKQGGTEAIGLTDAARYYVRAVDANTLAFYSTLDDAVNDANRISLTPSGGGSGETHALYSDSAAFHNSSGGLITLNVGQDGDTPSIRNSGGATTVVNNNKTVVFTGMRDLTEVRVYNAGTSNEIDGIEDATAGTPDDRSFSWSAAGGLSVDYVLHSVLYETIRVEGFVVPNATSTDVAINQRFDRNNNNP